MINKLLFGGLLIVGLALVVTPLANRAGAQQAVEATPVSGVEYAQLTIAGEALTWDEGGNQLPQPRNMIALQRQLGSNARPSMVNLLNAIGDDGWLLVSNNDSQTIWNFMRSSSAR